jgi:hypothetical protein
VKVVTNLAQSCFSSICNSASISGSKASLGVMRNAGSYLYSITSCRVLALHFFKAHTTQLNFMPSPQPSAHAVLLFADSQPGGSSLKVFAADACVASCRAATEVLS